MLCNEGPVFGGQGAMTTSDHPVTVERTFPDRTVFRPAGGIAQRALHQALSYAPIMHVHRQIDENERIRLRKPRP